MKRAFDVLFSLLGIIILFPFLLLIAILIRLDSKGSSLFLQPRVGLNQKQFSIIKFRTMHLEANNNLLLTIGNNDKRLTKLGAFLRRFKIDELPQLFNVLKGDMSFVGPRPELEKYVNHYPKEDMIIFSVRPGITSEASIKYRNEAEILQKVENSENYFIKTIIPEKNRFNKDYIKNSNMWYDFKIIIKTILKIFN